MAQQVEVIFSIVFEFPLFKFVFLRTEQLQKVLHHNFQCFQPTICVPRMYSLGAWVTVGPGLLTRMYQTNLYPDFTILPSYYFLPVHYTGLVSSIKASAEVFLLRTSNAIRAAN